MAKRRFRVQWAEVAFRDLEELVSYIATDSDLDANRVLNRLEKRAAALESNPGRGRVVPELAHFGMRTWRELVVRPYRLMYRIEGDTVILLAVFDGRRDLEDVLLERLLRT
jgi:addiction module RelE/StbE family toxin